MNEALLCLLKDFQTAQKVAEYLDELDEEIVAAVDSYIDKSFEELALGAVSRRNLLENGEHIFHLPSWVDALGCDVDDPTVTISFSVNGDNDEYWTSALCKMGEETFAAFVVLNGAVDAFGNKSIAEARLSRCLSLLGTLGYKRLYKTTSKKIEFVKDIGLDYGLLCSAFEEGDPEKAFKPIGDAIIELGDVMVAITEGLTSPPA